jgi:hypothetical protein
MPSVGLFPYPNASDAPDGPGAFLALATAVDGAFSTLGTSGLVPIVPASVSVASGAQSVSGSIVSFSGASRVSLVGVFSSAYRNYRVLLSGGMASAGSSILNLRFRVGNTDNSTAYYRHAGDDLFMNSASSVTSTLSGAWAGTAIDCGTIADTSYMLTAEIASPFLTGVTQAKVESMGTSSASGWEHVWKAQGLYTGNTSFDGFSLSTSSGSMTGALQIFGYNS